MDLTAIFLVTCAVAFVLSAIDYFVDLGIARAGIALGLALLASIPLEGMWYGKVLGSLAAAFLTMAALQLIERINYRTVSRLR